MSPKPKWWPENPYPEDVFTMTREQYCESVPDDRLRTAISGCLGRLFWGMASEAIWDAMQNAERETMGSQAEWRKRAILGSDFPPGHARPYHVLRREDYSTWGEVYDWLYNTTMGREGGFMYARDCGEQTDRMIREALARIVP
jgi:hypothetical protein